MKHAAGMLFAVITCLILAGCPPGPPSEHPSISVVSGSQVLIISGHGFISSVGLCAHLSMVLPGSTVSIGDPSCSGGGFADFPFPYSYSGCAQPKSTITATIIAQDPNTTAAATQTIQIPWDTNCMVALASCINSGAACQACGGEGQPVCSNGACVEPVCTFAAQQAGQCNVTQPDLHPNRSGGQLICTANCGHAQGYTPCYPYMDGCNASASYPSTIVAPQNACVTNPSGALNQFSCYDNSKIMNNGSCMCAPSAGSCPVNVSPANGACQSAGC